MFNLLIGGGLLVALTSFIFWVGIEGHKERVRRRFLPKEEQDRLEAEDAAWAQNYSF